MLLNVRSCYSLLNSTLQIQDYVTLGKEYGYQQLGLADINHLHGALTFQTHCLKEGIHPLIGMTLISGGIHFGEGDFPLVLYAKNQRGYQGLMKLSRRINQDLPNAQILWDLLKDYRGDLLAITPGRPGELEQSLIHDDQAVASQILEKFLEVFGRDNFYIGIPIYPYNQMEIRRLIAFAQDQGIAPVMNQLVQTAHAEDSFSLKVLQAIRENKNVDLNLKGQLGNTYLFQQKDLIDLYLEAGHKQVIKNTQDLMKEITFTIKDHQELLPKYHPPQGYTSQEYLKFLTLQKLESLGKSLDSDYLERLDYELSVIDSMGFSDYFLIVWNIISYCHSSGIRVGPGRGSAAGSLVSYLLEITAVDPIKYDLYFERFLNPERQSMPDIDIDIADNQRDRVLHYVETHYGHDNVAQIATFGTFGAKQAMRDTLRVLQKDTEEQRRWSRAIPGILNITLKEAYQESKALQRLVNLTPENLEQFQVALTIEGLPRHVSTHAAGIVINDFSLEEVIPVNDREGQLLITQFAMDDVEQMGLLKMDFLGLRNLSLLENILQSIEKRHGYYLDVQKLPENDPKTLKIFQRADTTGVFQFESEGIRSVLRKVHPTSFEDIVAVNALFRPGPMKQIDAFARRKHKQEAIDYLDPTFEKTLSNTYGIIVYQEQVMQVVQEMAGFTLGEADLLRRAMSQKEHEVMDKERQHFIDGATRKGVHLDVATQVFNYIAEFASYGFNRSHAVVYSTLAYQLAYMKAYYPLEFYQEILNSIRGHNQTMKEYFHEASERLGTIAGIDINKSSYKFTIQDDELVTGFEIIKGIRRDFIAEIIRIRQQYGPYRSLLDFLQKTPLNFLKAEHVEPLIAVGAFDSLGHNRATLMHNLASLIQGIEFSGNNLSLFGEVAPKIEEVADWSLVEKLHHEMEWVGLSLSGHPLDDYQYLYTATDIYTSIKEAYDLPKKKYVQMFGLVQNVKVIQTKKNEPMAFVTLSQPGATMSLVVFPRTYEQHARYLEVNRIIELVGVTDDNQREERQIIVHQIRPLVTAGQETKTTSQGRCFIRVPDVNQDPQLFESLREFAGRYPGNYQIIVSDHAKNIRPLANDSLIANTQASEMELKQYFGNNNVVFKKRE